MSSCSACNQFYKIFNIYCIGVAIHWRAQQQQQQQQKKLCIFLVFPLMSFWHSLCCARALSRPHKIVHCRRCCCKCTYSHECNRERSNKREMQKSIIFSLFFFFHSARRSFVAFLLCKWNQKCTKTINYASVIVFSFAVRSHRPNAATFDFHRSYYYRFESKWCSHCTL